MDNMPNTHHTEVGDMDIEAICNRWRAMAAPLPARARQVLAIRAMHRQARAAAQRSAPSYFEHAAAQPRGDAARVWRAVGQLQRSTGADPRNSMRGAI